VAKGDLSKEITVDVKGEVLELKSTINTMVDQLNAFAGEVSRVAKEVAPRASSVTGAGCSAWPACGRPHRQREFHGGDLTGQVRNIAEVTTRWRGADLSKKITVDVKGEIRAQEHHQHDGGSAQRLRGRSDARRAR